MFLPKVNSWRPFALWKTYSAWLSFCSIVLILTNGFASLSLIKEYSFSLVDILLTYSVVIFWGILEAAGAAVVLVFLEILLEKAFHKRLDLVFRIPLIAALSVAWFVLFFVALRVIG